MINMKIKAAVRIENKTQLLGIRPVTRAYVHGGKRGGGHFGTSEESERAGGGGLSNELEWSSTSLMVEYFSDGRVLL